MDGAVDLSVVVVDYDGQIVEIEFRRRHQGFPALAFLQFAVA